MEVQNNITIQGLIWHLAPVVWKTCMAKKVVRELMLEPKSFEKYIMTEKPNFWKNLEFRNLSECPKILDPYKTSK